jgi:hypothetical protein
MRDNNAKPDGMIDGRESGLAPGLIAKPGRLRQLPLKNRRHLIFKMT